MPMIKLKTPEYRGKRPLVERCFILDVGYLQRSGKLTRGSPWEEKPYRNGMELPVKFSREGDTLHLVFTGHDPQGREVLVSQQVKLVSTPAHFGGVRYWVTCPLDCSGRKLRKLYLPPAGMHFACRECHNLSYDNWVIREKWIMY
jgi:hypothetical protein